MKAKLAKSYLIGVLVIAAAFFLTNGLVMSIQEAIAADKWPDKPMQLVVPWKPGGGTDRSARALIPYLAKELGVPVTAVNIAGGGGWVAWSQMARWSAPKDEYMIGYVNIPHVLAFLDPRLKRTETIESFGWLALHTFDPCTWLVRWGDERFPDLKAFIEYGKKTPIKINVAGFGGDDHQALVAAQKKLPGFKSINVYSNSDAEKIATTLGGETDAIGGNVPYFISYVLEAKLRYLCVFHDERMRQIPSVPTFEEVTGKKVYAHVARAIVSPPNLPEEKRQILIKSIKRTFENPEYQMLTNKMGDIVMFKTGAELKKFLEDDVKLAKEVAYWKMEK